jgi:methanogenic corrinoid protein MtbC1
VARLKRLRDEVAQGRSPRRAVELIETRRGPIQAQKYCDRFLAGADALDEGEILKALEEGIAEIGLIDGLEYVVLRSMRELGDRWRVGECNVANEKVATKVVEAWLRANTDEAPFGSSAVILATGPRDLHRIGLESFGLLLSKRGLYPVMLDTHTRAADILEAVAGSDARAVVITAQLNVNRPSTVATLKQLHRERLPLFYAGNAFDRATARRGVPGTYLGDRLNDGLVKIDEALGRFTTRP